VNDGGRPAGAAVQAEAPNHLMVLWTKAMVLSDKEKAGLNQLGECEGDERPREPLTKASKSFRPYQNRISADKAGISSEETCLLSEW